MAVGTFKNLKVSGASDAGSGSTLYTVPSGKYSVITHTTLKICMSTS